MNEIGKIYKRPWGYYEALNIDPFCQIKKITVLPKQKLSLQKHFKRQEHWIIVKGEALITLNDTIKTYHTGEYIFIPQEALHRIENVSLEPVIIAEIQLGSYFGEDDIVRFDDIYGRALNPKKGSF